MLFNSYPFIFVFLPLVFVGFFLLARRSHRIAALWLAAASLFFYGWWNPAFVSLLLASILFNYGVGYLIGHARQGGVGGRPGLILAWGIGADLLLLGVFKYANFFLETAAGLGLGSTTLNLVLPLGISFFTFTQIAFLVDVHRGIAREYNFVHYLLFVTWFPHLIAGPVLHHKQMMPQFADPATYRPQAEGVAVGMTLFTLGLLKKVVVADSLARYAGPVFDLAAQGTPPTLVEAWVAALAYTLQLYFDFSAYSDMAIGLSRMFNVKLPLNFDSPYKAANIIDFWRRWHMTLSAFLRDYLYIPLGGNRHGPWRRHLNLMLTMLLGGLWHGAGWTFVLWGGLHGCYLVINHGWRRLMGQAGVAGPRFGLPGRLLGIGITFLAVVWAWVAFRATSLPATLLMWKGMVGANGVALPENLQAAWAARLGDWVSFSGLRLGPGANLPDALTALGLGLAVVWLLPNAQTWLGHYAPAWDSRPGASRLAWRPRPWLGAVMGVLFVAVTLYFTKNSPFLYFQF